MKRFLSLLFSLAVMSACQPTFDWTNLEGTWLLEKENNFCGNDTSITWTPDTTITLSFGPKSEFVKTITGTNIYQGQYSIDQTKNKITFTILRSTFIIGGVAYTDSLHSFSKEELFVKTLKKDSLLAYGEAEQEVDSLKCGSIGQWRKLRNKD